MVGLVVFLFVLEKKNKAALLFVFSQAKSRDEFGLSWSLGFRSREKIGKDAEPIGRSMIWARASLFEPPAAAK